MCTAGTEWVSVNRLSLSSMLNSTMPTPPACGDGVALGGSADRTAAAQHDLAGQASGRVERAG